MFGIRLAIYRWKKNVYYWLMSKLNNPKSIEDLIYNDILHTFAYNENGYYSLHMKNSLIGDFDLETIIQDRRGDYNSINELELNNTYYYVVDSIGLKFALCPNIKVIAHNKNGNKYFEVHWKNYKQDK